MSAMSRLLRPSHPPAYFPIPQNTNSDYDNDPGKETTRSLQGHGKRRICSHRFQLAVLVILLLLAGTAGFFIGLSFPRNRLDTSWIPYTVPQGSSFPKYRECPSLTSYLSVNTGLSNETFRYNESFAAPPPQEGGREPVWDSLIPSKGAHLLSLSQ